MHATLKKNVDLFAWITFDMPGVNPDIMTHKLSIFKEATEKRLAAKEETDKLHVVSFIHEARYMTWLANVVMVTNDKWRVCVDYTNLNKAYPKDSYPVPNIDQLVNVAVDHKIFNFLDVYSE